jgi:hypothetical protein
MRNVYLPLLLAGALTACKKEEAATPPSKTDLLTAKNWRLTAYTNTAIATSGNTTTDMYAAEPPCSRDNFMTYKQDKTLVFDEGPTKCNSLAQQTTSIAWAWQDDETTLAHIIYTNPGTVLTGIATFKYQLVELTASTLHVRYVLQRYAGGSESFIEDRTYTAF